jgi:hypothetical protein
MSGADALRSLHVFLLVTWLGIDVGVFTSSFVIRKRGLSPDARVEIRRIMRGLDLAPRLSLVLMIAVAPAMARVFGLGATGVPAEVLWLAGALVAAWCAAVIWSYQRVDPLGRPKHPGGAGAMARFRQTDLVLRLGAVAFFAGTGIHSLVDDGLWQAGHIAWKAILFAAAIAAGLWIRVAARPFGPALRSVVEDGETPAALAQMDRAMRRCYPAVLTVWSLVTLMAVIGIANP